MSADVVRHVMIRGRVQGVGYRDFTERAALSRGLTGWVRNRRDGAVEAVLAGPPALVADMIAACRRGPFNARVDAIEERDGTPDELALGGARRSPWCARFSASCPGRQHPRCRRRPERARAARTAARTRAAARRRSRPWSLRGRDRRGW